MPSYRLLARVSVVTVMAAAVIAGCSSSNPRVAQGPSTTTAVPRRSVAQESAYDAQLSTFATTLNAAGLVGTLDNASHYIVFAPDDEAFAKIPHAPLGALLSRAAKARLARLLEGHIVKTARLSDRLEPGTLTALNGDRLTIARAGSAFTVADAQGHRGVIATPAIDATNGVIYRIDSLLGTV
jgi:uncharacterized surface protein with fasciclin (FAS1) repeats